jgi:hypothetical protein
MQIHHLIAALVANNHKHGAMPHLDTILNERTHPIVDFFLHV